MQTRWWVLICILIITVLLFYGLSEKASEIQENFDKETAKNQMRHTKRDISKRAKDIKMLLKNEIFSRYG